MQWRLDAGMFWLSRTHFTSSEVCLGSDLEDDCFVDKILKPKYGYVLVCVNNPT